MTGMEARERGSTQREIRRLLEAYPGLHMREVARRLDIDVRAAKYHLDRLEKLGYVSTLHVSGRKRYFPRRGRDAGEVVDRRDKPLLSRLRHPVSLLLVLQLLEQGPASLTDLASTAEVSPSRAHYHLERLEEAALVGRAEEGREYVLHEPDRVRDLLLEYGPLRDQVEGFLDLWESFLGTA